MQSPLYRRLPSSSPARWFSLVALICCALLALAAAAARQPVAAPSGPRPPLVTIIKNDGGSVRGFFVAADPAAVSVKLNLNADPTVVPWEQIKRVSNGMT